MCNIDLCPFLRYEQNTWILEEKNTGKPWEWNGDLNHGFRWMKSHGDTSSLVPNKQLEDLLTTSAQPVPLLRVSGSFKWSHIASPTASPITGPPAGQSLSVLLHQDIWTLHRLTLGRWTTELHIEFPARGPSDFFVLKPGSWRCFVNWQFLLKSSKFSQLFLDFV